MVFFRKRVERVAPRKGERSAPQGGRDSQAGTPALGESKQQEQRERTAEPGQARAVTVRRGRA